MSLLAALKEGTTDCHASLEKSLNLQQRLRTEEHYVALLSRFFTIYEPLEAALGNLFGWEALGWDFPGNLKAPWLREDLLALGVAPAAIAAWPRWPSAHAPDNMGAAIGGMYVVEGSTLGGQLLAQQFRETLGITPERGGRFFRGYGPATMAHWRAFGTWAEAQAATDPALREKAVRGARDTFGAFAQWLT